MQTIYSWRLLGQLRLTKPHINEISCYRPRYGLGNGIGIPVYVFRNLWHSYRLKHSQLFMLSSLANQIINISRTAWRYGLQYKRPHRKDSGELSI